MTDMWNGIHVIWKVGAVIFAVAVWYTQFEGVRSELSTHIIFANQKTEELEVVKRSQAVMIEQLNNLQKSIDRVESRLEKRR